MDGSGRIWASFAAIAILGSAAQRTQAQNVLDYYLPFGQGTQGNAVSGNGTVSAGNGISPNASITFRAIRWTLAGGMQDLGLPNGASEYAETTAAGISRDGSTIVGEFR